MTALMCACVMIHELRNSQLGIELPPAAGDGGANPTIRVTGFRGQS